MFCLGEESWDGVGEVTEVRAFSQLATRMATLRFTCSTSLVVNGNMSGRRDVVDSFHKE